MNNKNKPFILINLLSSFFSVCYHYCIVLLLFFLSFSRTQEIQPKQNWPVIALILPTDITSLLSAPVLAYLSY